jgi:hypothetical protein
MARKFVVEVTFEMPDNTSVSRLEEAARYVNAAVTSWRFGTTVFKDTPWMMGNLDVGACREVARSVLTGDLEAGFPRQALVLCQRWLESERGWGVRPDGYSIHPSVEALKEFVAKYNETLPKEVPDEYSRPQGDPYWSTIELDADIGIGRRVFQHQIKEMPRPLSKGPKL